MKMVDAEIKGLERGSAEHLQPQYFEAHNAMATMLEQKDSLKQKQRTLAPRKAPPCSQTW